MHELYLKLLDRSHRCYRHKGLSCLSVFPGVFSGKVLAETVVSMEHVLLELVPLDSCLLVKCDSFVPVFKAAG